MRYCGFLSLPRAVLRYSYLPYGPLLLRKDLLNWSLAEFFSNITDCHSCHRRFAVSFPLPSYCLLKFTFLKNKSLAFMFCRKITICFCLFYIPWARQMTHEIRARFYVVCLFVFYLLSSYKRASGQHKACLRLKVIRHNQAIPGKKNKQFHLARYEVKQVHIL